MRPKNIYSVTDVESAGSLGFPLVYDVAWKIVDKKHNVLATRSFIVKEIFTDPKQMIRAYYANKYFTEYPFLIATGEVTIKPWAEIVECMRKDYEDYSVNIFCAYNAAFDVRALRLTHLFITTGIDSGKKLKARVKALQADGEFEEAEALQNTPFPVEFPRILDIYRLVCQVFLNGPLFRQTAIENMWITPNGNIQTTAQVAHRYLTGDYEFIEAHTALADVEIETDILFRCLTQKRGKMPYDVLDPACMVSRMAQYQQAYIHERMSADRELRKRTGYTDDILTFTRYLDYLFLETFDMPWEYWFNLEPHLQWQTILETDIIPEQLTASDRRLLAHTFQERTGMAWKDWSCLDQNFKKILLLTLRGVEWYVPDCEIDPTIESWSVKKYLREKAELEEARQCRDLADGSIVKCAEATEVTA